LRVEFGRVPRERYGDRPDLSTVEYVQCCVSVHVNSHVTFWREITKRRLRPQPAPVSYLLPAPSQICPPRSLRVEFIAVIFGRYPSSAAHPLPTEAGSVCASALDLLALARPPPCPFPDLVVGFFFTRVHRLGLVRPSGCPPSSLDAQLEIGPLAILSPCPDTGLCHFVASRPMRLHHLSPSAHT
jgi:hypothetical protein